MKPDGVSEGISGAGVPNPAAAAAQRHQRRGPLDDLAEAEALVRGVMDPPPNPGTSSVGAQDAASARHFRAASGDDLQAFGLVVVKGRTIVGSLRYERPAWVFDPRRIKDCALGAFTYINGLATTSLYRCVVGRYAQIGEGTIVGPPEHPQDWFSSHPFAFTRRNELPNLYRMPDFERLAPDGSESVHYVGSVPSLTFIGHEAYVGAGSLVKRGVRIGNGAVVGACSVVTRDVPDYAIVVGSPARMLKLRFPENLVERFRELQWWRYDLAPFKHRVDFSQVEATLSFFEERLALGELAQLRPHTYRVVADDHGFDVTHLAEPLYPD